MHLIFKKNIGIEQKARVYMNLAIKIGKINFLNIQNLFKSTQPVFPFYQFPHYIIRILKEKPHESICHL